MSIFQQCTHDSVAARIIPVCFRLASGIVLKIDKILQHIPRAIHFRFPAEIVAIVPRLDYPFFVRHARTRKQGIHFFRSEAKYLCKAPVGYAITFEIIEPCEYTFLGYAQAACQHCEPKRRIGLQCRSKHAPHKAKHLLIVTILLSVMHMGQTRSAPRRGFLIETRPTDIMEQTEVWHVFRLSQDVLITSFSALLRLRLLFSLFCGQSDC